MDLPNVDDSNEVMESIQEMSVAATTENSLGGATEALKSEGKESTEKPLDTMLKNTSPGNSAQEIDVIGESIADTSAEPTKEKEPETKITKTNNDDVSFLVPKNENAKLSAQTAKEPTKEPTKSSEKNAAHGKLPAGSKRNLDHFGSIAVKKRKHAPKDIGKHVNVQQLVDNKFKLMPKPVVNPNVIETERRKIETMTRHQLEDLVVQNIIEENKAKSQLAFARTQWISSENTLALYRRKIRGMSRNFMELETMGKNSLLTGPVPITEASGQKATLTVRRQPLAAGSILPPSSGSPLGARPANGPKPDERSSMFLVPKRKLHAAASMLPPSSGIARPPNEPKPDEPKCLTKCSSARGSNGPKQHGRLALAKSKEKAATNLANKSAADRAKAAKASIEGIALPDQDAKNTVKDTAKLGEKKLFKKY